MLELKDEIQELETEEAPPQGAKDNSERDALLTQGSIHHDIFLTMLQNKGQSDPKVATEHALAAENIYIHLLNEDYADAQVIYQLGSLYMQTNRNGLAIRLMLPIAEKSPDTPHEWWNNLGAAFRNEHCNAEARHCFQKALEKNVHQHALANICALWVNEGNPEKGIPYGRQALMLQPDHPQASWNMGLLLLENKEYEEGFKLYADGFKHSERIKRFYDNPEGKEALFWDGENLDGKRIVLWGEQGLGDELLFMQFVPEFIREHPDTEVILDVHPRLVNTIQRSFPDIKNIFPTRKSKEVPEWNETLRVDYKQGVGSLPKFYHTKRRKNAGWLKPNPELVERYWSILRSMASMQGKAGKPVIGIAWTGGKKKTRVDLRSLTLPEMLPILQQDCFFVSLEYIPHAEMQTGMFWQEQGILVNHAPDVIEDFDYDHQIALAASTDLVITVNTSIVHVCGSLDHPCWTLTPHGHAWRYGRKDKLNPFYNSVVQYHKNEGENWEGVVKKVAEDLRGYTRRFK